MVQYSDQHHFIDAPLTTVALAHNQRFPSPYSAHVISSDVISRSFHPQTGVLKTTKLILKRGKMPAWAPRVLKVGTSWVLEESELDMEKDHSQGEKVLRVRSRNIDHKTVMEVFEWQTFKEDRTALKGSPRTSVDTLTRITSEFGFWPLRSRIEKFGISRGAKSTEKARAGLSLATSLLLSPTTSSQFLSSGPLNPFPFSPIPSSLTIASELLLNRLDEARSGLLSRDGEDDSDASSSSLVDDGRLNLNLRFGEGDEDEPGRVWREKWRSAAREKWSRFRIKVCALTGLWCEDKATKEG